MKIHRQMSNAEIARLLRAIAAAYEIQKENRFKIIAYDRAATAVEHATSEMKDLWDDGRLTSVPGIGANIAQHLDELFRKGKVDHFNRVLKKMPPAMFSLLPVAGIGAKKAYRLCRELKIKNAITAVNELIRAAKKGLIAPLEGFGEKSQAEILEALEDYKQGMVKKKRMTLPFADAIAQEVVSYLKKEPEAEKVEVLGSLRRKVATVGDIDVAVATKKPETVVDWFLKFPPKKKVVEKGPSGASILHKNGCQIDLRVQKPEAFGSMIQYFIGSKHHNIRLRELALKKGLSLSEYGIKEKGKLTPYADEKDFYQALGLSWIPPEIREDYGEIEAAQAGQIPELIKLEDIKGDLHVHSNFPIEPSHDLGESGLKAMAQKAVELGYQYLGFSEHNPSVSKHSEKKVIDLLKIKKEKIDKLNYSINKNTQKTKKIKLMNGLEIDIKPNGSLAIPEKGLDLLDFAVVSVHSSFKQSRERMTQRILRGLDHPKVGILGHPTGRKLGQREGYEINWEELFSFCWKKKKILEINAWPDRLDLPDVLIREAVKKGISMVINTDSHAVEQMEYMKYGVDVARRGWAEKRNILNTQTYDKIIQKLKGGDN